MVFGVFQEKSSGLKGLSRVVKFRNGERPYLPEGGFVVLHDGTALADQGTILSIVGVSDHLEAGIQDVRVEVSRGVSTTTLIDAMPYVDSNGNESYDFPTSAGLEDGPYVKDVGPVLDFADIALTP